MGVTGDRTEEAQVERQTIDAWLDAMPVMSAEEIGRYEAELEQQIATAQRKLAVVRLIRQGDPESRPIEAPGSTAPVNGQGNSQRLGRKRRLSAERAAIIELIRQEPGGLSPTEVWRRLSARGMEATTNAIQTTMGRMVKDGQLRRVEQGLYQLAPTIQTAEARQTRRQELADAQSIPEGSEEEAMEP